MSDIQQEPKSVFPPGTQSNRESGSNTPKGDPNDKMASTGNEDLFKTGVIGVVDNKNVTGNEDLFKSGFAKSEVDSNRKSLQQKSQHSKHESTKSKQSKSPSRNSKSKSNKS